MNTTDCPGCGARNRTTTRRCGTCGQVIDPSIPELERGLAALHPDRGFGTSFRAGWGRDRADDDRRDEGGGDRPDGRLPAVPRWTSTPIEATIAPWEPTRDGVDDESVELAATIVLEAPLRNGATPPLLEYEAEPFDPDGLDWDRRPF